MYIRKLFNELYKRKKESTYIKQCKNGDESCNGQNKESSALYGSRPLFLVAPPRSGTTILTHIINSHPEILLTNESAVFLQLADAIEKSKIGSSAGRNYGKAYHALWADHLESGAKTIIESYYDKISQIEGKESVRYWGEKHPHLHVCLDFVNKIYPEATYLYLIRDPRDVALSLSKMKNDTFENQFTNWKKFSQHYEKLAAEKDDKYLFIVKYENLVENYKQTVENILLDLGVPESKKVNLYIDQNKDIQAHGVLGRKKFDGQSAKYRWRTILNDEQKRYAINEAGGYLEKYGYPT